MSRLSSTNPNFIYITDIHLTTKCPLNRNEHNIEDAIFKKLDYVKELAKKYKSEAIVHGGDLFDRVTNSSDLICRMRNWIGNLNIPFITVAGNHDIPGKNSSLYNDSSLSLLPVWLLNGTDYDIGYFRFIGYHYDDPRVLDILNGKEVGITKTGFEKTIGIIHYHVGEGKYNLNVDSLNITKEFDMVLFGDIHEGFSPRELPSGVIVGNPGALFRKTKSEINRKPKAYVVFNNLDIIEEEIPTSNDSFKLEKIMKEQEELGKSFLAILVKAKMSPEISLENLIETVAKECGYSKESTEVLLNVLHS